jgi:hypothetical protein
MLPSQPITDLTKTAGLCYYSEQTKKNALSNYPQPHPMQESPCELWKGGTARPLSEFEDRCRVGPIGGPQNPKGLISRGFLKVPCTPLGHSAVELRNYPPPPGLSSHAAVPAAIGHPLFGESLQNQKSQIDLAGALPRARLGTKVQCLPQSFVRSIIWILPQPVESTD